MAYDPGMELLDEQAFDFWVGEWDCAFDGGHAVNTVSREFGGKVLTERFAMDTPQVWSGTSVSVFHPKLHIWQQTWVDDGGAYWHFVGRLVDGNPSFATPGPADEPSLYKRMVFTDITANAFRWRWESSPDQTTWTENWAIAYERRA